MTAFDPGDWLDRFETHGGGWIVQDGKTVLLSQAGAIGCETLLANLEACGDRDAVLAHIMEWHRTILPVPVE